MRKLNRKGFTLVELLAVIIILAIVVGITIPAVLTTTSKAREKAFQTSVDSFANWLGRQYEAYNIGDDTIAKVDQAFKDYCTDSNGIKDKCTVNDALLTAGGLKPGNYSKELIKNGNLIEFSDGKFCVRLYGNKKGDFNTNEYKISSDDCRPSENEEDKETGELKPSDITEKELKEKPYIIDDGPIRRQVR